MFFNSPSNNENRNPLAPLENSSPRFNFNSNYVANNNDENSAARFHLPENDAFKLDSASSPSALRNRGKQPLSTQRNNNNNNSGNNNNPLLLVSSPGQNSNNLQSTENNNNSNNYYSPTRHHQHFDPLKQNINNNANLIDIYAVQANSTPATNNAFLSVENINKKSVVKTATSPATNSIGAATSDPATQQQQQRAHFISQLQKRLRTFFMYYSPGMTPSIETLIRRYAHREHDLWVKLFAKYGPFPDATKSNEKTCAGKSELVRYFRHYDPMLEAKVDDILAAFADFPDVMWKSLEVKYGSRDEVFNPKKGKKKGQHKLSAGASTTSSLGDLMDFGDDKNDEDSDDSTDDDEALVQHESTSEFDKSTTSQHSSNNLTAAVSANMSRRGSTSDLLNANSASSFRKKKKVRLPMDLPSRLRRFFEKYDPVRVSRSEEIAMTYRNNEVDLRDGLEIMYSTEYTMMEQEMKIQITNASMLSDGLSPAQGNLLINSGTFQQVRRGDAQLEPPPGGFKEAPSPAEVQKNEAAKRLNLSQGTLSKRDAERWLVAFCDKHAPEKMIEVELILSRFEGNETELREAMDTVFGQIPARLIQKVEVSTKYGGTSVSSPSNKNKENNNNNNNKQNEKQGSPPQAHRSEDIRRKREAESRRKKLGTLGGNDGKQEFAVSSDDEEATAAQDALLTLDVGGTSSSSPTSREKKKSATAEAAAIKRQSRHALKDRLERFFNVYNKKYVPECRTLSKTFLGNEKELFQKLCKVYGPEPATESMKEMFRERLGRIYKRYAPENLPNIEKVLDKNAGQEEGLMQLLVAKYGPEPDNDVDDPADESFRMEDTNMRLHAFFTYYEPSQIPFIEKICSVYGKGKERLLWQSLFTIYGPYPSSKLLLARNSDLLNKNNNSLDNNTNNNSSSLAAAASSSSSSFSLTKKSSNLSSLFQRPAGANLTHHDKLLEANNNGKIPDDLRKRMLRYFSTYDPSKIDQLEHIYKVYVGREDEMWKVLERRYGPEVREETLFSQFAIDKSKHDLRTLFEKYLEHYDPAVTFMIPEWVTEYLGREPAARVFLANRYGPEPRYNPASCDARKRLMLFFRHYDPPQLANVDAIADSYINNDEQLFQLLVEQYGPEPTQHATNRSKFKERLLRYFDEHPKAAEGRRERLGEIVKQHDEWDDEYMMDLVDEFGPEPPDPDAIAKVLAEQQKEIVARKKLEKRLQDFFKDYDPEQLVNVETLVDSYWNQPEEGFRLLYEAYNIETEEVVLGRNGIAVAGHDNDDDGDEDDHHFDHVPDSEPPTPPPEINMDLLERVRRMYKKYNRKNFNQAATMLNRYKDREGELLDALVEKYGPEPSLDEDLDTDDARNQQQQQQQPITVLRPIGPPPAELPKLKRAPIARIQEILRHCEPPRLAQLDSLLKRYSGMEEDLVAVLEEKYDLQPGTLLKMGEKLDLDTSEFEQQQRERMEQMERENEMTPRDRLLRLWKFYDPKRIPQLDLLLQKYEGREDQLVDAQIQDLGDEPHGDVDMKYFLLKFYNRYNPEKIGDVDSVLTKFNGRELQLRKMFITKYGEEPEDPQPLPPLPEKLMKYRKSVRARLERIYGKHAPEKVASISEFLEKYEGFEENLLEQLDAKYNLSAEDLYEDHNKYLFYKEKLEDLYRERAPEKLSSVDSTLKRYRGDERNLFEQLALKYPAAAAGSKKNNNNNAFDTTADTPTETNNTITSPTTTNTTVVAPSLPLPQNENNVVDSGNAP